MIDAKKFVVAFLILATLGSASAFLLFRNGGNGAAAPGTQTAEEPFAAVGEGGNTPLRSASAFTVQSSDQVALENTAGVIMAPATSSGNITSQIVDAYMGEVINANPNGLQPNASGTVTLEAPTDQALLSAITSSSILSNVKVPDWSADAAAQPLHISTDTSPAAVSAYSDALNNIVNQYITKTGLEGMVSDPNSATADTASFGATQLNSALGAISSLATPSDLADFQKSLMKIMVYDKNMLALAGVASADPVKAAAVFQGEDTQYHIALQQFQNAWQNAAENKAFSFASPAAPAAERSAALSFVDDIVGIPTAHAQWITFDPSTFAQMLYQWAQNLILQILKNTIIARLQSEALSLIQNSGNPLLIQMWGPFLNSAFNVAAGAALGQIMPGLCPNFSTNVGGWLKNAFSSAQITSGGVSLNGSPGTNCTLYNAVPNTSAYYNNFNTYGFNGFAALLQTNNNPYGAFIEGMDAVNAVAAQSQQAAQDKAVSSQGYKPQATCGSGGTSQAQYTCPSGTYLSGTSCYSEPNGQGTNLGNARQSSNSGSSAECSNGTEPVIKTPGITIGNILHGRLGSDAKLTVNANAITGLLTTVLTNVIMKAVYSSGIAP